MSDRSKKRHSFKRLCAHVLGYAAFFLTNAAASYADETINEIKFIAEDKSTVDLCHPTIQLTQPIESWTARILDPVTFQLVETHDAECQAEIILKPSPMYSCSTPEIQPTMMPAANGQLRTQNDVKLVCRYRQHGYFISTPFTVRYTLEDQSVSNFNASIPAIHIKLDQCTSEEEAFRHALRPWHRRLSPILGIVLAAIISCISCMFFVIRKRNAQHEEALNAEPEVIPLSALEVFNAKIAVLLDEDPEGEDDVKSYIDTLSEAIRRFLSTKLDLPIMESTTGQVRPLLEQVLLDGHIEELVRILRECDLIKFARMLPAPAKRLALIRDSSHIIAAINTFVDTKETTQQAQPDEASVAPMLQPATICPTQQLSQTTDQVAQNDLQNRIKEIEQALPQTKPAQSFEPPEQPKPKERLNPISRELPEPINSALEADLSHHSRRESVNRNPVKMSIITTAEHTPVRSINYTPKATNVPLMTAESLLKNEQSKDETAISLKGKLSTLSRESASELTNVPMQLSTDTHPHDDVDIDDSVSGDRHVQHKALLSLANALSEDVVSVRTTTPRPLHLTPDREEGLNFFTPMSRTNNKVTPS